MGPKEEEKDMPKKRMAIAVTMESAGSTVSDPDIDPDVDEVELEAHAVLLPESLNAAASPPKQIAIMGNPIRSTVRLPHESITLIVVNIAGILKEYTIAVARSDALSLSKSRPMFANRVSIFTVWNKQGV